MATAPHEWHFKGVKKKKRCTYSIKHLPGKLKKFKSKLHINPPPWWSVWVLLSRFFFCIKNIHPQRQLWARCCQICCIHFIQRFIFKTMDLLRVCTWSKRNGRHFWHWSLLQSGNSKCGDRKLMKNAQHRTYYSSTLAS